MSGDLPDLRDRRAFAAELTAIRERAGLTVRQVAAKVQAPPATIGGYFGGSHLPPLRQPSVLAAILEVCGVTDPRLRDHWEEALRRLRRLPGRRPSDAPAPYRGLASFGPDDADWFHGREELTTALVAAVDNGGPGPLMVVGPSGSGKSSLLYAGLVATLRDRAVEVAVTTPSRGSVASGVDVLVVDQFEEAFTHLTEAERRAFIDRLASAAGQVVLGLRSDFYDHALRLPVLASALQRRQLVVGPMRDGELRRAIVEPARRAGVELEDGLIEILLRDSRVTLDAGALPLLSHAMLATWERGRRHSMKVADYHASGGIEGAVKATAEDAYCGLTAAQQGFIRRALLRLVNADGEPVTRRRILREELPITGLEDQEALDRFIERRLLTADGDQVEIAHEALLSAWPRFREWIDADRAGLQVHRQLTAAAQNWAESGRDNHDLLRGGRLALAREWAAIRDADLNDLERDFLQRSAAHDQAEIHAVRRRSRRLLQLLAAVTVLALVAVGLTFYAFAQRRSADKQRDLALSRQLAITADELRATDVALAAQLALAAYRTAPTRQARSSLLRSYAGPAATRIVGPPGPVQAAALSPDGQLLVAGAPDHTVRAWRLDPGRPLGEPDEGHTDTIFSIAYRPSGGLVATAGRDRTIRLWRTGPTGIALAGTVLASDDTIYSLAFSPDSGLLAAGSNDGTVKLWRVAADASTTLVAAVVPAGPSVRAVAFSPDGHTLAVGGDDNAVRLFDVSRPAAPVARPAAMPGATGPVLSVAFSPDGTLLAAGARDFTVRLWDVANPDHPSPHGPPLTGPVSWVNAVAFSPDGQLVAGGSSDEKTWLWSTATGQVTGALPHPAPVTALQFGPGGMLTTAANDGVLRRWALPGPTITGPAKGVFNAIPADDAPILMVASADDTFSLWNIDDPRAPRPVSPVVTRAGVTSPGSGAATISPDGRTVAVGTYDGVVQLWDVSTPGRGITLRATLTGPTKMIEAVMFSPDSRMLAVAGDDHLATLWNVADPGRPERAGPDYTTGNNVYSPVFSSDGRTFGYGTADNIAQLWDVTDPRHPARLGPPLPDTTSPVVAIAFSPDRHTLATADVAIRLWDITDPSHPRRLAAPLTEPDSTVWSLAFAPDGRTLAAGTGDGTVWLWATTDSRAPELVATLPAHRGTVFTVAFDRASGMLVSGGADKATRLWSVDPEQVARFVCATAGDRISPAEWARLAPGAPYRPPC